MKVTDLVAMEDIVRAIDGMNKGALEGFTKDPEIMDALGRGDALTRGAWQYAQTRHQGLVQAEQEQQLADAEKAHKEVFEPFVRAERERLVNEALRDGRTLPPWSDEVRQQQLEAAQPTPIAPQPSAASDMDKFAAGLVAAGYDKDAVAATIAKNTGG